jgi:hypothetical protein
MANYFAVPSEAIESFLASKKFERFVQREEVVYVRRSTRNPNVFIKVYTSISTRPGPTVRASGKDAIRVCTVFDSGKKSFGIGKFKPIFRVTSTESVLERILSRIMEAANRGNQWIDLNDKAEFTRREAQQERAAFMSDPDLMNRRETCPRCNTVKCPDGCCCSC